MRKLGKRGGMSLSTILTLAVLVVGGYHAYVFGKPYYQKMQFEDDLFDVAETVFRQSDEAVVKRVTELAAGYGIPLEPGRIERTEERSTITIEAWWDVPVKTFLVERTLHFDVSVSRKFTR